MGIFHSYVSLPEGTRTIKDGHGCSVRGTLSLPSPTDVPHELLEMLSPTNRLLQVQVAPFPMASKSGKTSINLERNYLSYV